jgi:O-antigen/teichoic acid export membrane protein
LGSSDQVGRFVGILWGPFIRYVIQRISGIDFLVAYDLSIRVISQISNLPSVLFNTLLPVFSEFNALNNTEKIDKLLKKSLEYVAMTMLPLIVFILFFSNTIVKVWLGGVNLNVSFTIKILLVSAFVNLLTGPIYYAIISFGKPILGINKILISLFINLIALLMTYIFNLGYWGIISAEFLSVIFGAFYFIYAFQKEFKYKVTLYITRKIFIIFILSFFVNLFILFGYRYFKSAVHDNFFILVFMFSIYVVFLILLYFKFKIISKYEFTLIKTCI